METPFSNEDHQALESQLVKNSKPRSKFSVPSSDSENNTDYEYFSRTESKPKVNEEDYKQRKKRKAGKRPDLDEDELATKQSQKKFKEEEKRRKIKSSLLIAESDEESDEERDRLFFESELKLRKAMETASINQIYVDKDGEVGDKVKTAGQNKRRKTAAISTQRVRSRDLDDINSTISNSDYSEGEDNINLGRELDNVERGANSDGSKSMNMSFSDGEGQKPFHFIRGDPDNISALRISRQVIDSDSE